jgi:hypothetical protein
VEVDEAVGEGDRVLDRLVGGPPLMWHHRVSRVTHQDDAVAMPAGKRREVMQRPAQSDTPIEACDSP